MSYVLASYKEIKYSLECALALFYHLVSTIYENWETGSSSPRGELNSTVLTFFLPDASENTVALSAYMFDYDHQAYLII